MKLKDVKAPKIVEISHTVEKSLELSADTRLCFNYINSPKAERITIMTIADCQGTVTKDALFDTLMIEERPDFVFLLGGNTATDIETVIDFFSDNFYGYGSIMSEHMKICSISGCPELYAASAKSREKILVLEENQLFFKGLISDGASGDIIPECDILIARSKPDWVTTYLPDKKTEEIRQGRLKLILHASQKERLARYNTAYDCCVKSCFGIETMILRK